MGRLRRPALAAAAAAAALLAADFAARPLLRGRLYYRPDEMFLRVLPSLPTQERFDRGARFEGEIFGDLGAMSLDPALLERRRVRFAADERGLRNDGPPGGPLDLIVLGDSFAAGSGVSQEATVTAVLAARRGLRAYSLAVPNGGPYSQLLDLKLELGSLPVRPGTTLLWLLFSGNDLDDGYGALLAPRPSRDPRLLARGLLANLKARSPLWRLVTHWLYFGPWDWAFYGAPKRVLVRELPDRSRLLFYKEYERRRRRSPEQVLGHPNLPALVRVCDEMKRFAAARGLRVVVALAPSKEEVYPWVLEGRPPWTADPRPSAFSAALARLCAAEGFPFLDLKPALLAEARRAWEGSRRLVWWRDDTHWNGRGHEAAAEAVGQAFFSKP